MSKTKVNLPSELSEAEIAIAKTSEFLPPVGSLEPLPDVDLEPDIGSQLEPLPETKPSLP